MLTKEELLELIQDIESSRAERTVSVNDTDNFPWPGDHVTPVKEKIAATAQAILDIRAVHTDCSFAVLYDPLTMPPDLRAAHEANDRAVLAAYGLKPDTPKPKSSPTSSGCMRK